MTKILANLVYDIPTKSQNNNKTESGSAIAKFGKQHD